MKLFLLIFLLIYTPLVFSETNYDYLLKIINNELSEVSRLNKQIGASDDSLLLRMAELYLERGRVKKEQENEKFLSISPEKRRNINKKSFFTQSKEDMNKANQLGIFILKKFKNTKHKGDVFYIFAFYAQEYKGTKKAKEYFILAKKNSIKGSSSFKKSSLALADIYYNEKKFSDAINNYEVAIDDKDSKWWTRDAYNLAWCYFREGMETKGITLMKTVNSLSSKGFYLDLGQESERDLIYFYVENDNPNEAERFINRNGGNTKQLIRLAKNLIDQGKGSKSVDFLKRAVKNANNDADRAEVYNMLLDLYEKFGEFNEHIEISEKQYDLIEKNVLDEILLKNLKYHLKKMSSGIQEKIKSGRYKDRKKFELELADVHRRYVDLLARVFPKKSSSYVFFQAEIDYAVNNFERAAGGYLEVIKSKNRRIKKLQVLKNLLACLSKINSKGDFYQKNAMGVYETYLSLEKKLEFKKPIYPLLFTIYIDRKNLNGAEKILTGYAKSFRGDMKTIESMLATILNQSEIKTNKEKFLQYVKRINSKEFIISKKLASSIKNNALGLQFKGVQKESSDGQKANALRGYNLIYEDELSSQEARKNAAYNISVLYFDLKYPKKTAEWLIKALALMTKNDVEKLYDTLRKISLDLFNQGREDDSLNILVSVANLLCEDSRKFRSLARDYFNLYAVSGVTARFSTAKFFRCVKDKSFYNDLIVSSYDSFLTTQDHEFVYESLKNTLEDANHSIEELQASKRLAIHYLNKDPAKSKYIIKKVQSKFQKSYSDNIFYKELMAINRMFNYQEKSKKILNKKLKFPENVFNKILKDRIAKISEISSQIINDPEKGGVVMIGPINDILVDLYDNTISEISTFTPNGKSPEYVSAFRKSMMNLVVNLTKQRNDIAQNFRNIVTKKNILTSGGHDLKNQIKMFGLMKYVPNAWMISDREY